MTMTDPIADLLTRIRNAQAVAKLQVRLPSAKLKIEIVKVLQKEGFIKSFQVDENEGKPELVIDLKYWEGKPVITSISRESRPGLRRYEGANSIDKVIPGCGIQIVTTSKGVMTGREAIDKGIGGEILCEVA